MSKLTKISLTVIAFVALALVGHGQQAAAQTTDNAGHTTLHRAYSVNGVDHLYTTNSAEIAAAPGYQQENPLGLISTSQISSTAPFYRLYNASGVDHFYTASSTERDAAMAHGYVSEGVTGYIYTTQVTGTTPVYRLYHPGGVNHFYTVSVTERNMAIASLGYVSEGIAGYLRIITTTPTPTPGEDTEAPVITSTAPHGNLEAGTTEATLTVTTNEVATCRYSTTSGAAYADMTPFTNTNSTTHTTQVTGLQNGNTYNYYVQCRDAANNTSIKAAITFSVASPDTTPATISNGSPTGTLAAGTETATLSVTTNEAATCRYSTSDVAYGSMVTPFQNTGGTTHTTPVAVQDGESYTFYVRCADAAGNVNTTSYAINFNVATADTTAPVVTETTADTYPAGTTSIILSATTNELATCRYSTTSSAVYGNMTPFTTTGGTSHFTQVNVQDGENNFFIRCQDAAGNVNDPAEQVTVTVDSEAPVVVNTTPAAHPAGTNPVEMTVTTDEVSVCRYSLVSTAAYNDMTPFTTTNSTSHAVDIATADGQTYDYYVRCQDAQGNISNPSTPVTFAVAA